MAQSNRSIHLSVCKISKEVPGNHLASAGSACILEWAQEVKEEPDRQATTSRSGKRSQTFLVTTSQVVRSSDVTSSAACKADFLPVNWWSTKTFGLNNVPFKEKQIDAQTDDDDISLILIPTEPLHKQRTLSRLRRNEFELDRPQVCHRCNETGIPEASPGRLYCYVMRENAAEKSFGLRCYMAERDEDERFFLRATGNTARLRTLKDFDPAESPIASPILDEKGVVGFLGFGKNEEIRPLFLPLNREADGRSSEDDGQGSQTSSRSTDTEAKRDPNENNEDNQRVHQLLSQVKDSQDESDDSQIRAENHSEVEDSYEGPKLNKNITQTGNNYVPTTGEGSNRYQEEGNIPGETDCLTGGPPGQAANEPTRPPIQRCQSEKAITPRADRKLFKSYSEGARLPLKSGDCVDKVIYRNVYAMDTMARCLDTSYNRNVQYWQHLGYRQNVPEDSIMQLKSGSPESRSEGLFEVVPTVDPNLSTATLIGHLEELDMNDVVKCIKDLDPNLNGTMKVEEALESGVVPGRFYTLLDQKPEDKWNQLGKKLGLDTLTLKRIKINCANRKENPAEKVIEIICTRKPKMPIDQFKKHLENINRRDVRDKLNCSQESYSTITDVQNDLNLKRELTSMLNDTGKMYTYKDLAKECGIAPDIYNNLQPPYPESPTVEVMKNILGRKPSYTVDELFTDLREMDRLDVVEAISRYFKEEDMRVIKRQLCISDE